MDGRASPPGHPARRRAAEAAALLTARPDRSAETAVCPVEPSAPQMCLFTPAGAL